MRVIARWIESSRRLIVKKIYYRNNHSNKIIIFHDPRRRLFDAQKRMNSKWQYVTASLNRCYYVENLFRAVVRFRQSQSSISLSPFDSLKWILRDYTLHQTASNMAHYYELRVSLFRLDVDSYFLLSIISGPSIIYLITTDSEWRTFIIYEKEIW